MASIPDVNEDELYDPLQGIMDVDGTYDRFEGMQDEDDLHKEMKRTDNDYQNDPNDDSNSKNRRARKRTRSCNGDGGNNTIRVSNIAFDAEEEEVREEFSKVGEVIYVDMLPNKDGKFGGIALVSFRDPKSVQIAISSMNRVKEFKGRKLVIKDENPPAVKDMREKSEIGDTNLKREMKDNKSSKKDRKRSKRENDRRVTGNRSTTSLMPMPPPLISNVEVDGGNTYNTYGLSMSFLLSLNIHLPLCNTVFASNYGFKTSEETLRELFGLAGHVCEIDMFKEKNGASRGMGIIEYEHPLEAVQAISMLHNKPYNDRLLVVRMDRKKEDKRKLPAGLKAIGMGLGFEGKALKNVNNFPAVSPFSSTSGTNAAVSPLSQLTSTISAQSYGDVLGASNVGAFNRLGGMDLNPGRTLGISGFNSNLTSSSGFSSMGMNRGDSYTSPLTPRGMGSGMTSGSNMTPLGNPSRMQSNNNTGYSTGRSSGSDSHNSKEGGGGSVLGNIIKITNLPLHYDSHKLRNLCWTFGDVQAAELRSQGTGIVKFKDKVEAKRAVEMLDKQSLEGWMLMAKTL